MWYLLLRRPNGRQTRNVRRFSYLGTGKNIPNRVNIDLRMEEANKRIEIGHFEADTIESRRIREQQSSCLTVMVDRLSRKTIINKTTSKTSNMTSTSIIRAMKPYRNTIKSITYNNGCEFYKTKNNNKTFEIKSYFCKIYKS